MIARAAEGSVRDGLSLLDQAIAYCGATVAAGCVASMLGLIDRARVIDLFEAIMRGDAAGALLEFEEQHRLGGEPLGSARRSRRFRALGDAPQDGARGGRRQIAHRDRGRARPGACRVAAAGRPDPRLADAAQGHDGNPGCRRSDDGGRNGADPPRLWPEPAVRRGPREARQRAPGSTGTTGRSHPRRWIAREPAAPASVAAPSSDAAVGDPPARRRRHAWRSIRRRASRSPRHAPTAEVFHISAISCGWSARSATSS